MNRRQFNQFAARLGAVSLFTPALTSRAQVANFPNKPITLLVAFAPGGPADTMARAVAPGMSTLLGQSVVVENRPGANGKLAMLTTASATICGFNIGSEMTSPFA